MCGLSQFVSTQVDTDIAIWYCANSGYLNNSVEKDTFRFHLYNMEPMIKIVKLLNYPMDEGFQRHYQRTLALYYFLDKYKRSSQHQKKNIKNMFRALYQKVLFADTQLLEKKFKQNEVCTEFIPVDGPADIDQINAVLATMPAFCHKMKVEDLYYVSTLLDDSKQIHEIFIDYNASLPMIPEHEINWKYQLENYNHTIKICPKTIRPISVENDKNWSKSAKEVFGFSGNKELFKGCKYI